MGIRLTALETPPQTTQAEITLIGTGGGYGEACVVHLGDDNWILIDSCINPFTKKPLSLEYLESINIDIKNKVKLLICTHWHDDHINGMSEILSKAEKAGFAIASTHDKKKFLQLVKLDYEKLKAEASNASTIEFNNCIEILQKRGTHIKESSLDKLLAACTISDTHRCELISLSPSDYTIHEFTKEISSLITEYGQPNQKIIPKSPNAKSVAIFLKLGAHRAILGSDLEISKDPREGWDNIINNSLSIDKTSSLFKIPHHGSENGYHESIWLKLLDKNPISKLTPWNKKNKLPAPDMLKKYLEHTDKLYITSPFVNLKPKKRDKTTTRIIKDFNLKLSEVPYAKGIIRCRIDVTKDNAVWEISTFDSAFKV